MVCRWPQSQEVIRQDAVCATPFLGEELISELISSVNTYGHISLIAQLSTSRQ